MGMASLGQAHIGWVCSFHRRLSRRSSRQICSYSQKDHTFIFQVAQKGELAGLKARLHVTESVEGGEEIRNFHFDLRLELSLQNCSFFSVFLFLVRFQYHPSIIFNPHVRHAMNIGRQITPFLLKGSVHLI